MGEEVLGRDIWAQSGLVIALLSRDYPQSAASGEAVLGVSFLTAMHSLGGGRGEAAGTNTNILSPTARYL